MKKITYLVGVDGSEWSQRAAERAIHQAQQLDARVKLVYVLTWSHALQMANEGIVVPPIEVKDEEKYAQNKIISPILDKYRALNIELSSELIWGDPVEVLLEQIKDEHVNMVFMGRRGRSRLTDLIIGSVADKLAHCAGIPIVLVP